MTLPIHIQKGKLMHIQWKDRSYLKDYNSSRGLLFKFIQYNSEISYSIDKRHDHKFNKYSFMIYSILIHTPLIQYTCRIIWNYSIICLKALKLFVIWNFFKQLFDNSPSMATACQLVLGKALLLQKRQILQFQINGQSGH